MQASVMDAADDLSDHMEVIPRYKHTQTQTYHSTGTGHTEQGQVGENGRNKPTPSQINK